MTVDSAFASYCATYFTRLCRGYADSLDDSLVRAWLPGVKNEWDYGGNWLAPARMFPALAAWLADGTRSPVLATRGRSYDLDELVRAVVDRAFDPEVQGHWSGTELPAFSQETVETSQIAYGMWLLRDRLVPQLSAASLDNVERWLAHFTSGPMPENNKALFCVVTHAARKALGWDYSQSVIDDGWEVVEGLHRGDGWFTDGHEGSFDDYNWWVFGAHALMWAQLDGENEPALRDRVLARSRERLELFPYFFGADGSYTEYGRSLSYKFARLGFPVLAHQLGAWPHSAAMLNRLVHRHLAFYDNAGAIDRVTDVVRQELSEFGHPEVRELYIDTGSPYWCMHAFAALWQLPAGDPLWSAAEEPLPVERADFTRVVRPAGWILTGSTRSGQVHRHSLGSAVGSAKYAKFTYASRFPVNVGTVEGDVGPDAALCMTDGERWGHPDGVRDFAAGDGYLRGRYVLRLGGTVVEVETVLVPEGDGALRIHRLRVPEDAPRLRVVEGGLPFGYPAGATLTKTVDDCCSGVSAFDRCSTIVAIEGYTRALIPQGFKGRDDLNLIHQFAITPLLEVVGVDPGCELTLVAFAFAGAAPMPALLAVSATWEASGEVRITRGGSTKKTTLTIPVLS